MNRALDFWRNQFGPSRELQRFFDDFSKEPSWLSANGQKLGADFNPSCEVTENSNFYKMKFDLPGVPKDKINIDLHDNYLTVSGERTNELKQDEGKKHFSEVFYGQFTRSFSFPTQVDPEKVEAKFENGVLTVQVPKQSKSQARQVPIKG